MKERKRFVVFKVSCEEDKFWNLFEREGLKKKIEDYCKSTQFLESLKKALQEAESNFPNIEINEETLRKNIQMHLMVTFLSVAFSRCIDGEDITQTLKNSITDDGIVDCIHDNMTGWVMYEFSNAKQVWDEFLNREQDDNYDYGECDTINFLS